MIGDTVFIDSNIWLYALGAFPFCGSSESLDWC